MKKKKCLIVLVVTVIVLMLVIGIPLIINELYKMGPGYITVWSGADMLSFYGTMLGTGATILAMVITITFTRKQIIRESYLKSENEKWAKIESVFATAFDSINPLRPLTLTMETGHMNPSATIFSLQNYIFSCMVVTDQLDGYLNTGDYPKVKRLIDGIAEFVKQVDPIFQEEIKEYSKTRDLSGRSNAERILAMEMRNPNSFSSEDIAFSEKLLQNTSNVNLNDILETISKLNEDIIAIYHNVYRPLLQLKGSTFEIINTETQKEADNILRIWGRKPCPPLNGLEKKK
ncbi:hypothetical protein [Acutalibacter muris]|uniref:hypothetical protein n=1 Tax=Acutalibacter muris TaxID=1796620 RepID=UPI001C3ECF09|nr:hypothetical protein [Acutalibacter muris]